jgi:hypothetical protein
MARVWRGARDDGAAVELALYETLLPDHDGVLAPVFASFMALYESWLGRPIRIGQPGAGISHDEEQLLAMLDPSRASAMVLDDGTTGALAQVVRIGAESTRFMMRLALAAVDARQGVGMSLSFGVVVTSRGRLPSLSRAAAMPVDYTMRLAPVRS